MRSDYALDRDDHSAPDRPAALSSSPRTLSNPFATNLIQRVSWRLARHRAFSLSDQPDIAQKLAVKLVLSESSFDPQLACWEVFATTVLERYAATLLRDQIAEKRSHRRLASLNTTVRLDGGGTVDLANTVGQHEQDRRLFVDTPPDQERVRLRLDVEAVAEKLPAGDRELVERLRQGQTIAAAARAMGTPYSTLYWRVRQLRRRFRNC